MVLSTSHTIIPSSLNKLLSSINLIISLQQSSLYGGSRNTKSNGYLYNDKAFL